MFHPKFKKSKPKYLTPQAERLEGGSVYLLNMGTRKVWVRNSRQSSGD